MGSKEKKASRTSTGIFLIMTIPVLIYFIFEAYLPMFGALLAFKQFHFARGGFFASFWSSPWVGFQNFKFLFTTDAALVMFRNTILYNLVFIITVTVCSVALAVCINELLNKKMAKIYQTMMFFPYFLTTIVVSYFVFSFFSMDMGSVNGILTHLHIHTPVNWYAKPVAWPFIIIIVNLWKGIGYTSILYLATIVGIDSQYYEAAVMDGASKWQQIKFITIPHLRPIITLMVIMALSGILKSDFGMFYVIPQNAGALLPTTQTIDTYQYRGLVTLGSIGMPAAAGLFQSFVGLILILTVNKVVKKFDSDSAMF